MTRPEAWALFAAHALGQTMPGTPATMVGDKLTEHARSRVTLAAAFADAMTAEWVDRLEGPPQRDADAEVIAERREGKRRKGSGA